MRLALISLALPVLAFTPGLMQEIFTSLVVALLGAAVAVFALVYGIAAFRAKRAAHESPRLAAGAIAISVLPLLAAVLLLPSLGCYFGEDCGGG